MGKVMRHTLGASLNIRHNLSSSKGPKPLQLKLLTTYIPKTSAFTLAFSTSQRDRKSGSAGMPRPISYAVFCLKKKNSGVVGIQPNPLSITMGVVNAGLVNFTKALLAYVVRSNVKV